MSNPRIEEVSDSDPEIDDPTDFAPHEIMRAADAPTQSSFAASPAAVNPTLTRPPPPAQRGPTEADIAAQKAQIKPYTTLYPIYFSSSRTRHSGRRVSKNLASPNPLAFSILQAVRRVAGPTIRVAFEPEKTHPNDWSNPGRVKVQLFDAETNKTLHPTIKNRQYLYNLVAKDLKNHPTQPTDPLDLKLQGLPIPENFLDTKIAVPRGWKMGEVLPVHSAAVSGGGVSDNFFKDAMAEMQAMKDQGGAPQLPGGMDMNAMQQMMQSMQGMGALGAGGGSGAGGTKKKDKKKG